MSFQSAASSRGGGHHGVDDHRHCADGGGDVRGHAHPLDAHEGANFDLSGPTDARLLTHAAWG